MSIPTNSGIRDIREITVRGRRFSPRARLLLFWLPIAALAALSIGYSVVAFNQPGEDVFITLRYVRSFLDGAGLVFNEADPADRVEGYSNLLWVLILSVFGAIGAPLDFAARYLSFSSLSGLILAVPLLRRTRLPDGRVIPRHWVEWFAPLALFFQPTLRYVSDFGLETLFHALLLLLVVCAMIRSRHITASVLLAAMAANRPEGFAYWFCFLPVLFADLFAFYGPGPAESARLPAPEPRIRWKPGRNAGFADRPSAAPDPGEDRRARSHAAATIFLAYLVPWAVLVGALEMWRHYYYGAWLPNTVHAKIPTWSGDYVSWRRLWDFSLAFSHLPFVILFLLFVSRRSRVMRRFRREVAVSMVGIASVLGFALLVGGVPERFRHAAPAIPLFIGLAQLIVLAVRESTARHPRRLAAALGGLFLLANFYQWTNFSDPATRLHARTFDFATKLNWGTRLAWFRHEPVHINAEVGRWLDANLPPDALVAADQVGQLAYYSNRPIVDLLALNDANLWRMFGEPDAIIDYLTRRFVEYVVVIVKRGSSGAVNDFVQPIPFLERVLKSPRFDDLYHFEALFTWRAYPEPWAYALYHRSDKPTSVSVLGVVGPEMGIMIPARMERPTTTPAMQMLSTTSPLEIRLGLTADELSVLLGRAI